MRRWGKEEEGGGRRRRRRRKRSSIHIKEADPRGSFTVDAGVLHLSRGWTTSTKHEPPPQTSYPKWPLQRPQRQQLSSAPLEVSHRRCGSCSLTSPSGSGSCSAFSIGCSRAQLAPCTLPLAPQLSRKGGERVSGCLSRVSLRATAAAPGNTIVYCVIVCVF